MSKIPVIKDPPTIQFGPHTGKRWTRLPLPYLKYLSDNLDDCYEKQLADNELQRRGRLHSPRIKITSHAIDTASTRMINEWMRQKNGNEGLYTWLAREAYNAWELSGNKEEVDYSATIKLIFAQGKYGPVLKTIIKKRK